jgi:hypothetical protein
VYTVQKKGARKKTFGEEKAEGNKTLLKIRGNIAWGAHCTVILNERTKRIISISSVRGTLSSNINDFAPFLVSEDNIAQYFLKLWSNKTKKEKIRKSKETALLVLKEGRKDSFVKTTHETFICSLQIF